MITITKVDSRIDDDSTEDFNTEAEKVDIIRIFSNQLSINAVVEINTAVLSEYVEFFDQKAWAEFIDVLDCIEIELDKDISQKMKDFLKAENREDIYTHIMRVSKVQKDSCS